MQFFVLFHILVLESNAVLSHRNRVKFQDLRVIKKKCDNFNFFHQNFKPMCAMALMFCSNVLMRKGSRFKHKKKVCDFVMNEKNTTFISCVFNGFKYI